MTSTLDFYKLPINLYSKNFIMESLETYLGTLTPKTISSFQYQRFEMEKRIKVNISQDYQTYNGLTKYNYLRISQYNDNNALSVYYYFIKSAKQISESTIEFVIVMDVLNTFKYSTSVGQNNYNISEKSLITREHKNRIDPNVEISTTKPYRRLGTHYEVLNESFVLNFNDSIWESDFDETYVIGVNSPNRRTIATLKIINRENGSVISGTIADSFRFDYSSSDRVLDFTADGGSWGILIDESYFVIEFSEVSTNSSDLDNLDTMIEEMKFMKLLNIGRLRFIDRYQEGIDTITFKFSEEELLDQDGYNQWYVAFSSQNAVVQSATDTQATFVNPVQVDFISDNGYSISSSSANVVRVYPESIPQFNLVEEWLVIVASDLEVGGYVEINGTKYYANDFTNLYIEKKNNTDIEFRLITDVLSGTGTIHYENVRYIDIYGLNNCGLYTAVGDGLYLTYKQDFYIGSGTSSISGTSPTFRSYDLTDPKLIKIIAFPYSPREDLVGDSFSNISDDLVWNATKDTLELKQAQNNGFNRVIKFDINNPLNEIYIDYDSSESFSNRKARNIKYESKLLHSDFYLPKFVYDSFGFTFMLENIDIEEYNKLEDKAFTTKYVCSGNVQSKFMFQFPQYICNRETQDYNNVLVVARNNEKAVFNNAYINYIRGGGYAFDQKSADTSKMVNALTIGLSTIGAIGSFLSTPVTGAKGIASGLALTLTTATKTINAVHTAQQNDRQIAQKMLSASQQSTSISASEDIDILSAYSNNKAKICHYRISDELRSALWDLFHYFGYKCYEYKKPVINTRCNFNFIQGEIVLQDYTFNEDIANTIIEKYKEGVTFMHYDNSLGYDLKQEYENFETSLL